MTNLLSDLRYAARTLRRSPSFTIFAVLTLALGIGVNAAIFSVADALLLRPAPVESPEHLVRLHAGFERVEEGGPTHTSWSYPEYADLASQTSVFAGLAAHHHWGATLGGDDPVRLSGHAVTGNYFQVLGVSPALGRTLLPEDDRPGEAVQVVVISGAAWRTHFGGAPDVVGRTLTLDGHAFTVVGVVDAEPLFRALGEPELWVPIQTRAVLEPGMNAVDTRTVSFIPLVVGRLQPGVPLAQAQAVVDAVARRVATGEADVPPNRRFSVRPADTLNGLAYGVEHADRLRFAALLLGGVVLLVLLIACANVANLSLARAVARRQELGVRLALGAGRARIARQLLVESVVVAALGGTAGLLVAHFALALARRVPQVAELSPTIDPRVLLFTAALALGTGIVFGLAPALLAARGSLQGALRSQGRSLTRRLGAQRALIVGQIGLALLLVIASGLVLRTLHNLVNVDLGFRPDRLLVADVSLPPSATASGAAMRAAAESLKEEVRAIPGVREVGLSSLVPLSGARMTYTLEVPGYAPATGERAEANLTTVDDDYFRAIGATLLRGAGFAGLAAADTRVAVINEAMARRYWPGQDALGQRFVLMNDTLTVTGVLADLRHESPSEAPAAMLFLRFPRMSWGHFNLHVRAEGDAAALVAPLREAVRAATPGRPAPNVRLLDEIVGDSMRQARITATFFTLFGALALILAAVGLYGVMAYSVAQRTREIGIRMALGADLARVVAGVLRESGSLVALGIAVGLAAAYLATRLIEGVLFEVAPADPLTYVLGTLALAAVALLASYLPARRAARVDPTIALRAE